MVNEVGLRSAVHIAYFALESVLLALLWVVSSKLVEVCKYSFTLVVWARVGSQGVGMEQGRVVIETQ